MKANPPKLLAEIEVAASVAGPPTSVAVAPNESFALITAAEKIDPADPTKRVPNDVVTVLDLSQCGPSLLDRAKGAVSKKRPSAPAGQVKVLCNLEHRQRRRRRLDQQGWHACAGRQPQRRHRLGADHLRQGRQSRGQGRISAIRTSGPSAVSFTPDGKMALVTLDGESANKIAVLTVDGTKVEYTKRDMNAGLRPYGMDIAKAGDVAVVANIGRGGGDNDTVSVIDMKLTPPRVVNTMTVGQTPEGIKMSPDGKYVAVTLMNGSNKAETSPFYNKQGQLIVFARNGTQLNKVAEAPIGKWCQGIAWSSNSKKILAQCMVEEEMIAFDFAGITGKSLTKVTAIKVKGGPAGIRTAE